MFFVKRKVRLLFQLVNKPDVVMQVLAKCHSLGELKSGNFDCANSGLGSVVLLTRKTNRQLELALEGVDSTILTAVEDSGEEYHAIERA